MGWLSFTELDKAVVHVIRLAIFLWLWFQCVCPLMPSGNTFRLTWVSLTLDLSYLFTAASAKRSCCSLPWMRSISSRHPSWPWTCSSFSQPSFASAAAAPWTWGSSSRLPPLTVCMGQLLSAAPVPSKPGALGHCPWPWAYIKNYGNVNCYYIFIGQILDEVNLKLNNILGNRNVAQNKIGKKFLPSCNFYSFRTRHTIQS